MNGRGRPSRGLVGVVIAVSLAAGAISCSGDWKAGATQDQSTGAIELCGGEAVSAEAGKALKVITGSSRFAAPAEGSTVARAARSLSEAFASPAADAGDICQVFAINAVQSDRLEVTWELAGGPPEGEPAPKFTVLPMGERTLTASDSAVVQFACRSAILPGSTPAQVRIGVERWSPKEPEGDPEKLKDAYATVAHSISLAMAKELGCENNGGLEARPSLDPV
ncbi:hypothetical protein [Streptomyces sp. rh34]|uniref:hypothetical protein n=1 Tax=Streptomyces sp. rh34 TaxID=2034272 RepID=UPI0015CF235D|nr:hypothetical protein [Streptomyces sp. rh34]